MYNFIKPKSLNLKTEEIQTIAKAYKNKINFQYGDRLESLIESTGCKIHPGRFEDGAISIITYGYSDWELFMTWTYHMPTNNRWLAHSLAHYVLHSDMGNKRMIFINWDKDNIQIESEANIFSRSFLEFDRVSNMYLNC